MITREVLEAQRELYQKALQSGLQALEKAKADCSAASGAVEACNNLLKLLGEAEAANKIRDLPPE